jgi:hypothetical protein
MPAAPFESEGFGEELFEREVAFGGLLTDGVELSAQVVHLHFFEEMI